MTTFTIQWTTVTHPVTSKPITGYFILENGRVTQTVCYQDRERAVREARATAQIRTGVYKDVSAHGWPLVPSTTFPGEQTLSCPKCGAVNITVFSVPAGAGSGPGGSFRFGDNSHSAIRCNACGHQDIDKKVTVMK